MGITHFDKVSARSGFWVGPKGAEVQIINASGQWVGTQAGISGYSGYSGISGYSGYSGTSGYSGYSGISGYSGA